MLSDVFNFGVKAGEATLPDRAEGTLIMASPNAADVSTFNPDGLPPADPLAIVLKSDLDPDVEELENRLCRETTLSMIVPLPPDWFSLLPGRFGWSLLMIGIRGYEVGGGMSTPEDPRRGGGKTDVESAVLGRPWDAIFGKGGIGVENPISLWSALKTPDVPDCPW